MFLKILKMTILLALVSCATVVNNKNFDTPNTFKAPKKKRSLSITVFVKLYDENGEFYGYGYNKDLTNMFVRTFGNSKAFSKVRPLSSTCSEDYVCLDIPTSKKIRMQRHVNIIVPELYPNKEMGGFWKGLNILTLGLFPAFYNMNAAWEVNFYNHKRENLYTDDTKYEGRVMSAVWLHYRDDKLSEKSFDHYHEFYNRISKKILWNILFQMRRFP